jgi:geranylgeranyl reductase family protein
VQALLTSNEYDVIVVGSGPAGASASLSCAEQGLKTIMIEALALPRDKLCAGGVSPWVIEKLGIPEELVERTIQSIQVYAGSKKIPIIPWPRDMAYRMVMRREFDYFLVEKCRKAGVEIRDMTHVSSLTSGKNREANGVMTSSGEFKARLVIGCDGASSVVARTAGLWVKWWGKNDSWERWKKHQAFCLETQMHLEPQEIERRLGNTMCLLFEKDFPGYYWIFPKRRFLTVGVLSFSPTLGSKQLVEHLKAAINDRPAVSELLRGSEMSPLRGAYLPIRGPLCPSYSEGVMLAGDSASQVGAVWGEGIYFAVRAGLAAGETAVEAVERNDFSGQFLKRYEDRWKREIGVNLQTQAKILLDEPTPLEATIAFSKYFAGNRRILFT